MSLSSILVAMEAEAESEIQSISDQTAITIATMRNSAECEADRMQRRYTENAERQIDSERTRAVNLAKARDLRETAEALDRLFSETIAAAGRRLSEMRRTSAYPMILARLMDEALAELGEDAVVHADPRDKTILDSLRPGAAVKFDLNTWGGVEVSTADAEIVVRNTFEARLERARETMRHEITFLFEAEDQECISDTTTETHACVQ